MRKSILFAQSCLFTVLCACALSAQVVTFNTPSAWMSLREGDVVAKTLLDTAKVNNKSVELVLYKIEKGVQKRLGASYLKAKDYSQESKLGTVSREFLGGRDYLKIEWRVRGGDDKGSLEPFGIARLQEGFDTLVVGKWLDGGVSLENAGKALAEADYRTVGGQGYAVVWDKNTLGFVCKKGDAKEAITFCLDGKNGKSAFLSYPDRMVSYLPESDSVHAYHCTRSVSDTGIVYTEQAWNNEITKTGNDKLVLISVPWYDLGVIPFDGRMCGYAVFCGDAAAPQDADRVIPGTWGDIALVGGGIQPIQ